jgi:hypothetical protein
MEPLETAAKIPQSHAIARAWQHATNISIDARI